MILLLKILLTSRQYSLRSKSALKDSSSSDSDFSVILAITDGYGACLTWEGASSRSGSGTIGTTSTGSVTSNEEFGGKDLESAEAGRAGSKSEDG